MFQRYIQSMRRAQSTTIAGEVEKRSLKKTVLVLSGIAFVLTIALVAVYSSYELYKIRSPNYQLKALEQQKKNIANAVGKLIELPDDTPQIATVSDVEALKPNQPFFEKAKNGDQLLVFQAEAILYRPSTDKIINVAPVNRQQPQPTVSNIQIPHDTKPVLKNK